MSASSRPSAPQIEAILQAAFSPTLLQVSDDSAAHAGHAGAAEGSHFSVRIVSERFVGVARVGRHRLVYDALRDLMTQGIHALALDTRAPGEH